MTRSCRTALLAPLVLAVAAIPACGPPKKAARRGAAKPSAAASAPAPRERAEARPGRPPATGRTPSERPAAARSEPNAPVEPEAALGRDAKRLEVKVVGVHDGDTITVLTADKRQLKVRLDAIDAPELDQPHGQASKKALSGKVFGRDVVVIPKTTDQYGRTIGHVLVDGRDVNLEMIEEGMAWHYEHYDHNVRLREAERSARAGGVGLWQDRDPEAPWAFRSEKRHAKQAADGR